MLKLPFSRYMNSGIFKCVPIESSLKKEFPNLSKIEIKEAIDARKFEINLDHTSDLLKAADDSALLRRVVKETAIVHGYEASFISKPFVDQVGSGMHVHTSLFDHGNNNIFESAKEEGSKELSHAIAGLQNTMYEAFAIFASNKNSYRRFEPDQFVFEFLMRLNHQSPPLLTN